MHIVFPIYKWNKNNTSTHCHIHHSICNPKIENYVKLSCFWFLSIPFQSNAIIALPCITVCWGGNFFRPKKNPIKESIFCGSAVNATFPCLMIATWKIFYPYLFSYPFSFHSLLDIFNRLFFHSNEFMNIQNHRYILRNDNYVNIFGMCNLYNPLFAVKCLNENQETKLFNDGQCFFCFSKSKQQDKVYSEINYFQVSAENREFRIRLSDDLFKRLHKFRR